jgi:hypothetical protein
MKISLSLPDFLGRYYGFQIVIKFDQKMFLVDLEYNSVCNHTGCEILNLGKNWEARIKQRLLGRQRDTLAIWVNDKDLLSKIFEWGIVTNRRLHTRHLMLAPT